MAHFDCISCGDSIRIISKQGHTSLRDKLCSGCFKHCFRWAMKNGDYAAMEKVKTAKRASETWHQIRDSWLKLRAP